MMSNPTNCYDETSMSGCSRLASLGVREPDLQVSEIMSLFDRLRVTKGDA
jgi:hypothetical protein